MEKWNSAWSTDGGGAGAARGNPTASVVVECLLPVLQTCPICSGLHWSGNLGDR